MPSMFKLRNIFQLITFFIGMRDLYDYGKHLRIVDESQTTKTDSFL